MGVEAIPFIIYFFLDFCAVLHNLYVYFCTVGEGFQFEGKFGIMNRKFAN